MIALRFKVEQGTRRRSDLPDKHCKWRRKVPKRVVIHSTYTGKQEGDVYDDWNTNGGNKICPSFLHGLLVFLYQLYPFSFICIAK